MAVKRHDIKVNTHEIILEIKFVVTWIMFNTLEHQIVYPIDSWPRPQATLSFSRKTGSGLELGRD